MVLLEVWCLPTALSLPIPRDLGTSRWQLGSEGYTTFLFVKKGTRCPHMAGSAGAAIKPVLFFAEEMA